MGRSGGARGARVARAPNKGFARRQQEFLERLYVAIAAFGRRSGSGCGSGREWETE